MSNLCGSVDVVRERERQARLQLLDEYRDPSPQPIFSQPVKVELEDETSRRIKDTLGDFTQVQHVLINDPKHLIGISRSGTAANAAAASVPTIVASARHADHGGSSSSSSSSSTSSTWSSTRNLSGSSHPSSNHHSSNRGVPGNKRPVPVNGLHKPPTSAFDAASSSRRPHHPTSKLATGGDAKKVYPYHHPGPSKPHRVDPPLPKVNPVPSSFHFPPDQEKSHDKSVPGHREKESRRTKSGSLPADGIATATPPLPPPTVTQNGGVNNISKCTPPSSLPNGVLPNGAVRKRFNDPNKRAQAKFAMRKLNVTLPEEKSDLSHFEVESILKEMKQAVPPPLTAIQTPRTEERGFSFVNDNRKIQASPSVKKYSRRDWTVFSDGKPLLPMSPAQVIPQPAKKSPVTVSPFNLQEDLEMSESDDEGNMVPSCKNPEPAELAPCPKSPVIDESATEPPVPAVVEPSAGTSMGVDDKTDGGGRDKSAHSSSSESSDSDSEDSCSESNDSESSSEASDLEAPAKPAPQLWGLSNFFDETRKNHSPAFVTNDNNTNSSITAAKEEPPPSVNPDKDGFSLADEDSVNCMLPGKYSDREMKDYFQSPMDDLFMMKNGSISLKSEVISPIPSPMTSPVLPPTIPRGPRTPPSPPEEPQHLTKSPKGNDAVVEREDSRVCIPRKPATKCSPAQAESNYKSRTEEREDRHSRSKRKSATKTRQATHSPKSRSDHRKDSSACKEIADVSSKEAIRPLPSVSRATHRSPGKSHHKHSTSAKRDSSQTESSKKSFPDSSAELPVKSKNISRLSEQQPENAAVSSRGNSRGSSTTKSSDVAFSDSTKTESEKPEPQSKHGHRSRDQHKSGHKSKSKSSNSKNSSSKGKPKSDPEMKRPEKKKSSKFSLKNFLHSPCQEESHKESFPRIATPAKQSPVLESPEASPRTAGGYEGVEGKRNPLSDSDREGKQRKLSTSTSRSRSRSGSRTSRMKENRKRSSGKKHSSRASDSKRRHKDKTDPMPESNLNQPNSMELSKSIPFSSQEPYLPELLSPIPSVKNESAIPILMVCIPLSRLSRVPGQLLPKNSTEDPPSKDNTDPSSVSSCDRPISTSLNVSPSSKKDFKAKHRTDSAKTVTSSFSEKKSNKVESVAQKSASSSLSDKNSIESVDKVTKPVKSSEGQPKKRKSDKSDAEHVKKKPKTSTSQISPKPSEPAVQLKLKEKMPIVKLERMDKSDHFPQSEKKLTPKRVERRDSTSSLSSLCSQQSHKSSKTSKEKTKDNPKDGPESKKPKVVKSNTLFTAKEIKKEKEDSPKMCIKKEPGLTVKAEKLKSKTKERISDKSIIGDMKAISVVLPNEGLNSSSQINYWEGLCKMDDAKAQPTNHQRLPMVDYSGHQDVNSDWERFAPDIQQEFTGLPNHLNKVPGPMAYYYTEGKKLKYLATKETDPIQQAFKYFEATVMFILSSLHRELSNKDPDSIYQMYKETLRFSHVVRGVSQKHQTHSMPGNIDFKILILCLKCQSLLHLKLYSLKIKEVKEQHKGVSDFMHSSSSRMGTHSSPQPAVSTSRNLSQPSPCQPRIGGPGSVPSPHSPTPSPAGSVASVGSQSSGYSSSEVNGNPPRPPHSSLQLPHMPPHGVVAVPQNTFDVMARHHTHLSNLHMCHELWEQADMYMTRSNSKDFFKEVAEKSEKLSLHSSVKELVNYLQTGLSLLKDC